MHDANGIQTISSTTVETRPVPHSNVVIYVIYKIAPISPSEERRDHGGCPLLESGRHTNTGADTGVRPYMEMRPDLPSRPNVDTGIRPDTQAMSRRCCCIGYACFSIPRLKHDRSIIRVVHHHRPLTITFIR